MPSSPSPPPFPAGTLPPSPDTSRPTLPMTDRYATVNIDVEPSRAVQSDAVEIDPEAFHLLVIGDFSARAHRGEGRTSPQLPRPLPVDRDEFDAVLARLAPRLRLSLDADAPPVELEVREIDDFHPDGLYARAPLFARLRDLRRRAMDPAQSAAVAAELAVNGRGDAPAAQASPSTPAVSGVGLLDLVVAETAPLPERDAAEAVLESPEGLNRLIRALVRPHLAPRPDPRQPELLRTLDGALRASVLAMIHHPVFRAAEAAWRSLFLLVRSIETSATLKVDILDVTEDELDAALADDAWLPATSASGVDPAVVVPLHPGSADAAGAERLRRLAGRCARAGAACVAGVPPELVGVASAAALTEPHEWAEPPAAWESLRRDPAARHLGAALPRFLLRLPYGADGDECESFAFEELGDSPADDDLLWGSAAIVCAILLARSFADAGWRMRPGTHRQLDDLPLPILHVKDEVVAREPVEGTVTERAAEALLARGVTPLIPVRERGVVRLARFQSAAEPLAPLAGRWSST